MINSLSHRITAVALAMLILLVSVGFSIDIHFCKNNIEGISFFGKAKSCHEKEKTPACHDEKKSCHMKSVSTEKDNCCHNDKISIEKSEFDTISFEISNLNDFHAEFVQTFALIFEFCQTSGIESASFETYKPPLPDKDIPVLYQSFLI